jgi:hypothetical protein
MSRYGGPGGSPGDRYRGRESITRRQTVPHPPPPLYQLAAIAHSSPGLGLLRGRKLRWLVLGKTTEGGVRSAGEDRREEGGDAAELHLFRPPPSSFESERNLRRTKRWASFPNHFGASGVGNERGSGWNSGTPEGIRAEFRAQIPHPSKRWNSGPNSTIPNS